nr:paired-like homeodomain transcription factor LEUTX isoform X13 [Oryctolagus cuniculus]XP_051702604.1 paired-like homeodomain transcription factor LEUTX isoform X13 [Oryctolagus cuniculus]XP_051702605.1 paired-like homeodomain transcription factor LEUTX isoform X13 [Oryctolagus cuniculus]XP_051702606.1 paired-like homeodomain transcription factor LEUTX isoform X13 [Oryctolagus cuniculus]XP_051702607.1 paired-like homeodomain transcription factor LEUTX isoform X13 [Oryctolagus cuniculus]XP_05
MLKAVFETTPCPDWEKIQELAAKLCLDECVIKTWFKNQRAKQRKLQRKGQPWQPGESPPPPGSELSAPSQEDHGPESSQAHGPEAAEDPLPADLQNIHLDSSAPWASLPHDIGELVHMYGLFDDDEPDD